MAPRNEMEEFNSARSIRNRKKTHRWNRAIDRWSKHTHTRKLAKMEIEIIIIIIIIITHWNEGEANKLIITLNELYHTQEDKKKTH